MAEPPCKRPRDDDHSDNHPHAKKQRPYHDMILSLLEDDEDDPSVQDDLSSFITSLQRELDDPSALSASSSPSSFVKEDANESAEEDQEDKERVMRRLLEASDDELGLPSREELGGGESGWVEEGSGDRDVGIFCDGLWEIEHQGAEQDYQDLLRSEELLL